MRYALIFLGCVLLFLPMSSQARTWFVRQDGSGDCTTIQACLDLAASGDSVLVGPGTYPEHLSISAAACLISEAGPASTVIDGTHTGRCIYLRSVPPPGVLIQGFTVYNGYLEWWADWEKDTGAGIFAHASSFNIRDNVIRGNYGGGVACDAASSGIIADNEVRENKGGDIEPPYPVLGLGIATRSSNAVIEGNLVRDNQDGSICIYACSPLVKGNTIVGDFAILCNNCGSSITENVIAGNRGGVSVYYSAGTPTLQRNTIAGNTGFGVETVLGAAPTLIANIIAYNSPAGVYCNGGTATLSCNDVWGNEVNYYPGCPFDTTADFHVDPLFCDRPSGDYTLSCYSPCANHPTCGRVGALPVACGPTSTSETTWGRIKSLYR